MTAVDHAELGSDLGYWEMEAGRLHEGQKLASEFSEVEWGFLKRALTQSLALLSEIEGLKAERDEWKEAYDRATRLHAATCRALRTQAPDSWRPVDVTSLMVEAYFSGWEAGDCGDEYDCNEARAEAVRLIADRRAALRPQTAESGE